MTLAPDKIKHIIAGLAIYLLAIIFVAPVEALLITTAIGLAKEYIVDKYITNGTAELMDAIATFAIPTLLTIIISLFK